MPPRSVRFVAPLLGGAVLACAAPALPARAAEPIRFGHELVAACRAFVAAPADRTSPCRKYLFDYMTEYKQAQDARLSAQLSSAPLPEPARCIRMPDYLSFADLAALVVTRGDATFSLSEGPAEALVEDTLAVNFPCPGP